MRYIITLSSVCLLVVLVGVMIIDNPTSPAMKDEFKDKFLLGAAVNNEVVNGKDQKAVAIVQQHFNTITAEDEMKWERIHPKLDEYTFKNADRFVEFGQKNNMFIIGHTLIWQSQIPEWAFYDQSKKLIGREAMLARMKDHIYTVVGRYKGKVHGWDVVNEALSDEGPLNKSKWLETIGEDFIAKAFEYAHDADPSAELYYNDYSLDKPSKRDATVRLVKDLQSKGLRIDGVGIQGHWGIDYPLEEEFDAFVNAISALKIKVMVTELDVDILPPAFNYFGADINKQAELRKELNPYAESLPDSAQVKLTKRYNEIFSMLLKHTGKISRVTFWGVYDGTSWLNNWPILGRTSYPLLFDRNYQPKPAFYSVLKTVKGKK